MEPKIRSGTRKAINELAEELNLPINNWIQDWPYEVIIPADIEKYLEHYETLTDDDKKFVLMQGIIQATEDQEKEELFSKYSKIISQLLEKDFNIHEYTIHYWSCFATDKIEDCWKITPIMRNLLQSNNRC